MKVLQKQLVISPAFSPIPNHPTRLFFRDVTDKNVRWTKNELTDGGKGRVQIKFVRIVGLMF
ncbi:MAG: hypothetical protein JRJ08_03625 [Deltaproteobacteria bacterium]|nr:hypothetical protein [Deltaproteobacteria bacterium]